MILEKMFGNLFGIIWLVVFILAVWCLLIYLLFVKKDKLEEVTKKDLIKEIYKECIIEENFEGKFELKNNDGTIIKSFDSLEDAKIFVDVSILRKEDDSNYEIIEVDNNFKVRKKGSERTLRKFATMEEAQNFVKGKGKND